MAKQSITLSKEALAALRLPLDSYMNEINDKGGTVLMAVTTTGTFYADCEIAAALADLINAAFTPAASVEPENNAELRQAVGL